MKQELREQLGKAVYAKNREVLSSINTWEQLDEDFRELYRLYGEAAVSSFMQMIMPGVQNFMYMISPVLTKEQHKQFTEAVDFITSTIGE